MGVLLNQTSASSLYTARTGLEQRQGRMSGTRWSITYSAHLSGAEREARIRRMLAELAAPLWVPFWPRGGKLTTDLSADAFTMSRPATASFFRPGDWVYLLQAGTGYFREIVAADGNEIELVPDEDAAAFTAGTWAFPCRKCVRDGNGAFQETSNETVVENLTYNQL